MNQKTKTKLKNKGFTYYENNQWEKVECINAGGYEEYKTITIKPNEEDYLIRKVSKWYPEDNIKLKKTSSKEVTVNEESLIKTLNTFL